MRSFGTSPDTVEAHAPSLRLILSRTLHPQVPTSPLGGCELPARHTQAGLLRPLLPFLPPGDRTAAPERFPVSTVPSDPSPPRGRHTPDARGRAAPQGIARGPAGGGGGMGVGEGPAPAQWGRGDGVSPPLRTAPAPAAPERGWACGVTATAPSRAPAQQREAAGGAQRARPARRRRRRGVEALSGRNEGAGRAHGGWRSKGREEGGVRRGAARCEGRGRSLGIWRRRSRRRRRPA